MSTLDRYNAALARLEEFACECGFAPPHTHAFDNNFDDSCHGAPEEPEPYEPEYVREDPRTLPD